MIIICCPFKKFQLLTLTIYNQIKIRTARVFIKIMLHKNREEFWCDVVIRVTSIIHLPRAFFVKITALYQYIVWNHRFFSLFVSNRIKTQKITFAAFCRRLQNITPQKMHVFIFFFFPPPFCKKGDLSSSCWSQQNNHFLSTRQPHQRKKMFFPVWNFRCFLTIITPNTNIIT